MSEENKPLYRVAPLNPQNILRRGRYIGTMSSPEDAALVVAALNGAPAERGEPGRLIDGDGDEFYRTGPDEYRLVGGGGHVTYTRAEIDGFGPGLTQEFWS